MVILYILIGLGRTMEIAWCNLLVSPQNTAVVAGQFMGFECRAHNGWQVREWTLLRASPVEYVGVEKIYSNWDSGSNSAHSDKLLVDVNEYGSGRLYSNSTALEDAGLYACLVEIGEGLTSSSAQLIVLESNPLCETSFRTSLEEGNRIRLRCSVRFRGYWTPSMEWRHHREDKSGRIIAADEVVENANINFTSTIYIVFNSSTNNSRFSCKTYFANEKNKRLTNATNAPDFTYTWTSPDIKQIESAYFVSPTPLITNPLDTGFNSSINLYFVSLIAVGSMAAFFCCVATVQCIRKKRTASADPKTMSSKEINIAILSGQGAVSHASSMYETIDDEAVGLMAVHTVKDGAYLSTLHPGSRPSSTGSAYMYNGEKLDSVAFGINQKTTGIAERYENAERGDINQPYQTRPTLPNPNVEFPSPGGNDPADLSGYACEDIDYMKIVAQVRAPAPYESLQPPSKRDSGHCNSDMASDSA